MATKYWLLKSEPKTYPIDALKKDKRTPWTGIRNYQARNFMRDEMQVGDLALFYHSGAEKAVVGVAKVVSRPHADETAFDKKNKYSYDPKSDRANPTWVCVDVAFARKFKRTVSLAEIKNDPSLEGMLLRKPTRLSIQPVSEKHFNYIAKLGGSDTISL